MKGGCSLLPSLSIMSGQPDGFFNFGYGLRGDRLSTLAAVFEHFLHATGVLGDLSPAVPEGFQVVVQVARQDLLAVHAADTRPAALDIDHVDLFSEKRRYYAS